jgi:hypothetical protein
LVTSSSKFRLAAAMGERYLCYKKLGIKVYNIEVNTGLSLLHFFLLLPKNLPAKDANFSTLIPEAALPILFL